MAARSLIFLLFVFCTQGCTSLFLVPDRFERISPDRLGVRYDEVWLDTSDGLRLHAWHLKADSPRRGTVLFFHGNGQNISAHIVAVHWLPAQGFDVFLLDPRGYGRSEGGPDIDGVHRDAQLALAHLARMACGEIVVFGQSLGGTIGIHTVASSEYRHCVRGVIAEATFSTYRGIAREKLRGTWLTWLLQAPLSYLVSDVYSAEPVIARLSPMPLLLVHGEDDRIVPPHHSERLYEAAREPRELWLLPDTTHIMAMRDPGYRQRLAEWIGKALEASSLSDSKVATQALAVSAE